MTSDTRTFEAAIPAHLEMPRSRQRRISDRYTPPHQSFVARFKPSVHEVGMAFIGVQYRGDRTAAVDRALEEIAGSLSEGPGSKHWDRAQYVDEAGYTNVVTAAYWDSRDGFESWLAAPRNRAWWSDDARCEEGIGYFREIFVPGARQFETIFSHRVPEGVSHLAEGMSGEVVEHGYWGSSRDRIALAQVDELEPSGEMTASGLEGGTFGRRIRVAPQENLCIIRSGQDWADTDPKERQLYLEDVYPSLAEGMRFLRDEGLDIGCFSNRFMTMLGDDGGEIDKSYSVSLWRGLAELERWAESHPTHLAIFVAAIRHYSVVGEDAMLRVYHEVSVVSAEEQMLEYINCHPQTGLLKAVQ